MSKWYNWVSAATLAAVMLALSGTAEGWGYEEQGYENRQGIAYDREQGYTIDRGVKFNDNRGYRVDQSDNGGQFGYEEFIPDYYDIYGGKWDKEDKKPGKLGSGGKDTDGVKEIVGDVDKEVKGVVDQTLDGTKDFLGLLL